MKLHPRDGRTLLGHLGRAHTHHHDHIQRSRLRIRRFELRFGCRTVVCTSSPAYRVAMGQWGQCPPYPRDGRTLLGHLGGHTHTTTITYFSVPDSVFDGSNCGSGVIQWCAHHQHLGYPWGIGGNDHTPKGWQDTAWLPWGSTHTHHNNHIIRFELRFGASYDDVHINNS